MYKYINEFTVPHNNQQKYFHFCHEWQHYPLDVPGFLFSFGCGAAEVPVDGIGEPNGTSDHGQSEIYHYPHVTRRVIKKSLDQSTLLLLLNVNILFWLLKSH
jgi:hypothetical protein